MIIYSPLKFVFIADAFSSSCILLEGTLSVYGQLVKEVCSLGLSVSDEEPVVTLPVRSPEHDHIGGHRLQLFSTRIHFIVAREMHGSTISW